MKNNIFIERDEGASRIIKENEQPLKDRIMYSKPFRRLSGKYSFFWKIKLGNDRLIVGNNIDVGLMRNKINDLHFKYIDKEYKSALLRTVCDYIAGMTDKYIIDRHRELYNINY